MGAVIPILDEDDEVKGFAQGHGVGVWLIWGHQQEVLMASPGLSLALWDAFQKLRRLGTPWPSVPGNRDNLLLYVCGSVSESHRHF